MEPAATTAMTVAFFGGGGCDGGGGVGIRGEGGGGNGGGNGIQLVEKEREEGAGGRGEGHRGSGRGFEQSGHPPCSGKLVGGLFPHLLSFLMLVLCFVGYLKVC